MLLKLCRARSPSVRIPKWEGSIAALPSGALKELPAAFVSPDTATLRRRSLSGEYKFRCDECRHYVYSPLSAPCELPEPEARVAAGRLLTQGERRSSTSGRSFRHHTGAAGVALIATDSDALAHHCRTKGIPSRDPASARDAATNAHSAEVQTAFCKATAITASSRSVLPKKSSADHLCFLQCAVQRRNFDAVRNAIDLSWVNGQPEGAGRIFPSEIHRRAIRVGEAAGLVGGRCRFRSIT